MKKRLKRIGIALSLVSLMIFSVGCGSSGSYNSTTSTTSTTSTSRCQFKDSDGVRRCTNEATHGELCDYHFKMLNDTYNDMTE